MENLELVQLGGWGVLLAALAYIAKIVMDYASARNTLSQAGKTEAEKEAQQITNEYAPQEKLANLAERVALVVSERYEKIIERQDEIISSQTVEIEKLKAEIVSLEARLDLIERFLIERGISLQDIMDGAPATNQDQE